MGKEPWGWHLAVDATGGLIAAISSHEIIRRFVEELIVEIDMKKYGPMWIDRFATHDPSKAGISFCQMIETSNITGHFVEKNGDFYLDIFSCKPFTVLPVEKTVRKWLHPSDIRMTMSQRGLWK